MAKVVFMGTPEFAVPVLRELIASHDVIGVVTQPDRPAGRNRQLQLSPVKQVSLEYGIPVLQPEKLRHVEAIDDLKQWPAEVYVVAAFGQILPQAALDIPPFGSINVHASLLPRWRGAAPIQAAIREGDGETGITIMRMDAGLDTGPILSQRAIHIAPDETGESLHDKLSLLGAQLLSETLPRYLSGELKPQPQPQEGVTISPQITKEQGQIDWSQAAKTIERLVRAFTPWPGTYTTWNGKQLKIHQVSWATGKAEVGLVVEQGGQIVVGTGDRLLVLRELQLEGKKRVSIDDFLRGHGDFLGTQLR